LILVSQINREASKSESINITHLKDSSALEQDSDIVFLISKMSSQQNEDDDLQFKVKIGKNRHGQQNIDFIFEMDKSNFRITYVKKEIENKNFYSKYPVSSRQFK
jgi:replicative DNA helicase